MTDPEPFPVAYLRVDEAGLEEKPGWVKPGILELRSMLRLDRASDGLDDEGRQHLDAVGRYESVGPDEIAQELLVVAEKPKDVGFAKRGRWFAVSASGTTERDEEIGAELRRSLDAICGKFRACLLSKRTDWITILSEIR